MKPSSQKHTFHVHGMHCASCVLLTETEIGELPFIISVKSNLSTRMVEVEGNFADLTREEIAEALSAPLKPHGYRIALEREQQEKNWSEFKIAIPIAVLFAVVFVMLQKIGLVNLVQANGVSFGTAFLIGVIASVSTCMAVVGGLLLSMSATYAKEGDSIKPQVLFHTGRIISFFLLGGVIGAVGAVFTLNGLATFVLSFLIGIVMLLLGINLLDVFPWAKKFQPAMPKFITSYAHGISEFNHTFTPFLVGIATFFLPCGFTQSMQIYTLSTGNFLTGSLTMLTFALGTLPVLALISFSSMTIVKKAQSGLFFKSAGLIVIMFAVFNLLNSMVVIGILPPLFNF